MQKDKNGKDVAQKKVEYKNGVRSKATTTVEGPNGQTKTVSVYNDKGKITDKTVKLNGKVQNSTSWEYDKNGNVSKKTIDDKVGNTLTTKTYSNYKTAKDGTVTRDVSIVKTDNNTGKTTEFTANQKLNKDGKLTRSTVFNSDGKKVKDTKIEYDKKGNFKSKTTEKFYSDGSSRTVTLTNKQSNGLTTTYDKTITFTDKDGKTSTTATYKVQQNADGTITRVKSSDKENIVDKFLKGAAKLTQAFVDWFKGLSEVTDEEKAAIEKEFMEQNGIEVPDEEDAAPEDAQDPDDKLDAALDGWTKAMQAKYGDQILDITTIGNTVIMNMTDGTTVTDHFDDEGNRTDSVIKYDSSTAGDSELCGTTRQETISNLVEGFDGQNIEISGNTLTATNTVTGEQTTFYIAENGDITQVIIKNPAEQAPETPQEEPEEDATAA